ncbi:MAG TPA: hypothetical protein VLG74_11145 [Blastocatellia bacterium]|nr:hypothetical protein [Blastocatellia bacterium]
MIHLSATVEIEQQAIGLAELPWMVMLLWYLIVMMDMDAAAAAAVIGEGAANNCPGTPEGRAGIKPPLRGYGALI